MIQQYMLQFYIKSTGNVTLAVQRGIFKYYIFVNYCLWVVSERCNGNKTCYQACSMLGTCI